MKFLFFAKQTLTLLFWVILTFGFDTPDMAILTVSSALIHECGHFTAIYIFGKQNGATLYPDVSGFRIKALDMSYKEEAVSALAGPLVNLAIGIALLTLSKNGYLYLFGVLNLMTAISNLLPIKGYDGYRALHSLISLLSGDSLKFELCLCRVSFILSSALSFLSLYLILKINEGYWIFFVFFSTLLSEIFESCESRQKTSICEKKEDFERF